jgi:hypothetical protein
MVHYQRFSVYILINPVLVTMHSDRPIILLCLTPDDFTHQGESVASQWVKHICKLDS